MRNQHPGPCYQCGDIVLPEHGHFHKENSRWVLHHAGCAIFFRGRTDVLHINDLTPAQREKLAASRARFDVVPKEVPSPSTHGQRNRSRTQGRRVGRK